ncbi:hypothetical protein BABINDRAFT_159935 [Babjeviella inositovora NRRL Y-12698]|uniref:25S rRNA (uridine-N(3))-methyltransferase BMT5-like domain-containing protein n=1 Tax=Babjeviella inositovora NRRL Y-12698 TaxID=984486 RepID=A0A1E3QXC5_9ASCO|nr:uncharacterized protein BABINDRAFT_159935 [Babjeviella inositovora NRRL Y-12698]ODQ81677.1 hypothetical protein BABINDRAFT_159935 [Babjeviella inositovora NRRL Y-12698]
MARKNLARKRQSNSKGLQANLARHLLEQKMNRTVTKKKDDPVTKAKKAANKNQKIQPQANQRGLLPFTPEERVLLVGEGDFSFAASLIKGGLIKPENLVATSFDSLEEVLEKYPATAPECIKVLETADIAGVQHDVDATSLIKTLGLSVSKKNKGTRANWLFPTSGKIDVIMFNFPHTGRGMKDMDRNIRDHQNLILEYFRASKDLLNLTNDNVFNDFGGYRTFGQTSDQEARIVLTLFEGEPYLSWQIKSLAKSEFLKVERSGKLEWEMFPGYHHKRTNGVRDTTKPASEREARIYVFDKYKKRLAKKEDGGASDSD